MSGPYFNNKDGKNSGLVQTAVRPFNVWGFPRPGGNVASENQPVDSALLSSYLETCRALRQSLDGTETSGDLGAPSDSTTGHVHEESFDGGMSWMQIASYQLNTVITSTLTNEVRYFCSTTSTSYVRVLYVPFVVPIGITNVVPCFYVKSPDASPGGTIKFDFYTFGTNNTPSVIGGELSTVDNPYTVTIQQDYLISDTRGYDLSGIATTNGHRVVVLDVQIKSTDGTAFGLVEVQLLPSTQGYRATPTKVNFDSTKAAADATLTEAKLATIFVTNPQVLRNVTYGTTLPIPTRSTRHDHGEGRGEPLKRHYLSVALGPHSLEGGAYSPTVGLPLNQPDGSVDFTVTPKLMCVIPLHLNAQVGSVAVYLTGYLSGSSAPRSVSLKAEIRPRNECLNQPALLNGKAVSLTLSTAADGLVSATGDITTVYKLGPISRDRLFELCIWQTTNPASTESYRLSGVAVHYRSFTAGNALLMREDLRQDALEQVTYGAVRTGQEINATTFAKGQRSLNQCANEILGGVQGLKRNLSNYDTTKSWVRKRKVEQHQHRGCYTDGSGVQIDDGAVLRYPLVVSCYYANISGNSTEDASSDNNPSRGVFLHSAGTLGTSWIHTGGIVTIPQGLGAIEVMALIQPGTTDPRGRLFCFASVVQCPKVFSTPLSSTIATRISCGDYEGSDNQSAHAGSADEVFCEVNPEDGLIWQENRRRLGRGLGCWTLDALRQSQIDAGWEQSNPYRWTLPIRIDVTPTTTGVMRVRVKWALQTGDYDVPTAGTYASTARILGLVALPARGY